MTLQARRTGLVNPINVYNDLSADTVMGIPVSLSTTEDATLVYRNQTLVSDSFLVATQPSGVQCSSTDGQNVTLGSGYLTTKIGGYYSVSVPSLVKNLNNTWALGNNGGRASGISLTDGTYHLFVIYNPVTNIVDAYFDTSIEAVNRPSNWVARRVASVVRSGGAILAFNQYGTRFEYVTPVRITSLIVNTSATLYNLVVPVGLEVLARYILTCGNAEFTALSTQLSINARSPAALLTLPTSSPIFGDFRGVGGGYAYSANGVYNATTSLVLLETPTNTAGQIQMARTGNYSPGRYTVLQIQGWIDFNLAIGK